MTYGRITDEQRAALYTLQEIINDLEYNDDLGPAWEVLSPDNISGVGSINKSTEEQDWNRIWNGIATLSDLINEALQ